MIAISNYYKRTPKKWKLIGDICLFAIPILETPILALPISDDIKAWIAPILALILGLAKIITKFLGSEPIEPTEEK